MYVVISEGRVGMLEADVERVLYECADHRRIYSKHDPLRMFCRALLCEAFIQDVRQEAVANARRITICLDHTIGELAKEGPG